MIYLSLVGGIVLLTIAGDFLVRGAVSVADRYGISHLVIGLTIVSLGTSAPELMVSVKAALGGSGGIALGNVIGSNIANVLLVLGFPSIIMMTDCSAEGTRKSLIFMLAISVLFVAMCSFGVIDRTFGMALLALFFFYLFMTMREAKAQRQSAGGGEDPLDEVSGVPSSMAVALGYLAFGLIGLPMAAHFTVEGAVGIARAWHVSEAAIGLTLVALGTSLPELSTTLMATIRNHGAVAIGNVIGSNVFNLLGIVGVTTVIAPIAVPPQIMAFDGWVMLATSALLLPFVFFCWPINRAGGIAMLVAYACYIYLVYTTGQVA